MTQTKLKYKNIFLVGFMGAGKSTVGKILADKIGYNYLDADQYIEEKTGTKITKIFADHGEPYFRDLESEVTEELAQNLSDVLINGINK